jgi:hypothetical protein
MAVTLRATTLTVRQTLWATARKKVKEKMQNKPNQPACGGKSEILSSKSEMR